MPNMLPRRASPGGRRQPNLDFTSHEDTPLVPKVLYFDCFSGASGDMILGALIDAGLPLDELRGALGSLALDGVTLEAERVDRSGVAATKFRVHDHEHEHEHDGGHAHDHDHGYAHDHGHHHHRGLSEICSMVDGSGLSDTAKERAKSLFRRFGGNRGGHPPATGRRDPPARSGGG